MSRVLMVSSLWPPKVIGGAEAYAARLAEQLRRRGHAVGAVTLGVDGPEIVESVPPWPYRLDRWATEPRWRRVLFHATDVHRRSTTLAIERAVAGFRPDVVHSHAVSGMSVAALTTPTRLGVAHVHTLHDHWLLCQRTSLRHGTRPCSAPSLCSCLGSMRDRALRRHGPQVVVAPSRAIARRHQGVGALRDRIRVVHHPVDAAVIRPRTAGAPTFGFLGQLTEVKGVATLLRAFDRVGIPGARLLVAGTGPLEGGLRAAAPPAVDFLGWLDGSSRERFFDAVDCLVVPSEWEENAPLVVPEAAARGRAVIAADIGGLPEYVPPPCLPLLFRSGDVDDLRRSLRAYASDPGRYPATVEHLPTWDGHVDSLLDAYDDASEGNVLSSRGARR